MLPARTSHLNRSLVLVLAALCVLVGAHLRPLASGAAPAGMHFQIPQPVVALSERQVCALLDPATGDGASITGQDGGASLRVGDTTYWTFGDTGLSGGLPQIPNNIATTTDSDGSDCVTLDHKAVNGAAAPLLPAGAAPDESTVWPGGMVAAQPGVIHFFYASMAPTPAPFALRFIGLAKFDPATLAGVRLGADAAVGEPFWPPSYGIINAYPLLYNGEVYVYFSTANAFGFVFLHLARVAPADIEDVTKYEYWDGGAFTPDFASSTPIVTEFLATLPTTVAWNDALGKWTMAYAAMPSARTVMRVADAPTGPWSAPVPLFDCRTYYRGPGPLGSYCYVGTQHAELAAAGGDTIYVTVSNELDYRVFLHEVRLATPVWQATDASGSHAYVASRGAPAAADGIAFYAGTTPGSGLSAIHQWVAGGDVQYGAASPGAGFSDGGVAFYAPLSPTVTITPISPKTRTVTVTRYEPVFRWDSADTPTAHVYSQFGTVPGYVRGGVAFYAPCPDTDGDGASDCIEDAQGTDPRNPDTDGDGHADLAAPDNADPGDLRYDNCPNVYNPDQANHDSNLIDLKSVGRVFNDITWPNSDPLGDACDPDADNDGLPNDVETGLGPGGPYHALCPSASGPTDPLSRDTDGDMVLDGAECALGTDPASAASVPPRTSPDDSDHDGLPDWFELKIGTDPHNADSDGDGLIDGVEVKAYNTDPLRRDTDGDGCSDAKEVASVNADHSVGAPDLVQVIHAYGPRGSANYLLDMDINKDGTINSADLQMVARLYGPC